MMFSFIQSDSLGQDVDWPNKEYVEEIYNPETHTYNPSYNYSNKWDFDGDGKKDCIFFIGNGGAHTYFFPRLILSSNNVVRDFPCIELDMPYIIEDIKELDSFFPQFVVYDFDADGILELYFNISSCNPGHTLPRKLRKLGIKSERFLMDFSRTFQRRLISETHM